MNLSLLVVSFLFGCAIRIDPADKPIPTKSPDIPAKVNYPGFDRTGIFRGIAHSNL